MDVQDGRRTLNWIPKNTRVNGGSDFETSGTDPGALRIPLAKTPVAVPAKIRVELK
jgi:hypothetical protein